MKLSYRGINYEYNPIMIEPTEMFVNGKYRGNRSNVSLFNQVSFKRPLTNMIYRGARLQSDR